MEQRIRMREAQNERTKPYVRGRGKLIFLMIIGVACLVGGALMTYSHSVGNSVNNRIQGMNEHELWVYGGEDLFTGAPHPAAKEVVLHGCDKHNMVQWVLISSWDNIRVEERNDGKDFATIQLVGSVTQIDADHEMADSAIILVPHDKRNYYKNWSRELHDLQSGRRKEE